MKMESFSKKQNRAHLKTQNEMKELRAIAKSKENLEEINRCYYQECSANESKNPVANMKL